jgi:hypothetical protein
MAEWAASAACARFAAPQLDVDLFKGAYKLGQMHLYINIHIYIRLMLFIMPTLFLLCVFISLHQCTCSGVCDVEDSGGATSPAACCARCLPGRCGGFVFLGSTCFLKAPDCPAASRTRASLPGGLSAFVGA